ncbi:hypothetical protein GCM10019059_36700 [Camelimonas fluminis]|nr:hypothetical protein GCM10019059_36700 [Camelimonas fluminis]
MRETSFRLADAEIRLVPKPLWGISLASVCTAGAWAAIRAHTLAADNGVCRFHATGGAHRGVLEAHERWHYHSSTATLTDVWGLCPQCHAIFHPGRTLAHKGQSALQQLAVFYAQRADIATSEAFNRYDDAFQRHRILSETPRWTISLQAVESFFPLKIRKSARETLTAHIWSGNPFRLPRDAKAHGTRPNCPLSQIPDKP